MKSAVEMQELTTFCFSVGGRNLSGCDLETKASVEMQFLTLRVSFCRSHICHNFCFIVSIFGFIFFFYNRISI